MTRRCVTEGKEMNMGLDYGVLRGSPDRAEREDGENTPHLQIRASTTGQPWRIAVNVESDDGWPRSCCLARRPLRRPPPPRPARRRSRPGSARGGHPPTRWTTSARRCSNWPRGRVAAGQRQRAADDLQDLLVPVPGPVQAAGGEVYAFGARFDHNLHKPIDVEFGNTDGLHGIHDIHLNQGNTGRHAGDNGCSRTAA